MKKDNEKIYNTFKKEIKDLGFCEKLNRPDLRDDSVIDVFYYPEIFTELCIVEDSITSKLKCYLSVFDEDLFELTDIDFYLNTKKFLITKDHKQTIKQIKNALKIIRKLKKHNIEFVKLIEQFIDPD